MKSVIMMVLLMTSTMSFAATGYGGGTVGSDQANEAAKACFQKEYSRVSKERKAVGAVMTADIEDYIQTQCGVEACFNSEYARVSDERQAVGAVMTADIENDIQKACSSGSN